MFHNTLLHLVTNKKNILKGERIERGLDWGERTGDSWDNN
jgi:hypothetical protein